MLYHDERGAANFKTFGVLTMNWKSILFIGVIAVAAVFVFNRWIGPKIGATA